MMISNDRLNALPTLSFENSTHNNGGKIYFQDQNTILKIFDMVYFEDETERNIDFQIQNNIPNTPRVYDKVYVDREFKGYSMEYKKQTMTFRDAGNSNISYENKLKAIMDVYQGLKFLHENDIYLGDIHSDNFLIDKNGHGYLIDLEEMRFPGDEFKFNQCYLIRPNSNSPKINIADAYTDNVKTLISSLTLLTGIDLEKMISKKSHDINLEEIRNDIILPLGDDNLTEYFDLLVTKNNYYFDDFIKENYLPKEKAL